MALPLQSREIAQVVAELTERVRQLEGARRLAGAEDLSSNAPISSGDAGLDRLLPQRGLRRGTLVEWLAAGSAAGAGTLALAAAREAARGGGALVVVDRPGWFYPPAAVRLGIDLEQLILVRPANAEDHAWALDQVLRTRGVAAVWSLVEDQDDHTLRRWQLAAESGGALGLLVRPARVRDEPSWAELRLLVEPITSARLGRGRRVRVTLARSRAGPAGRAVEVEIPTPDVLPDQLLDQRLDEKYSRTGRGGNDETRAVHLASSLAAAKARRRSRGA